MTALSDAQMSNTQARPRPLMTSPEALASNGGKENRNKHFRITLSGTEIYELLQLLEQSAVDAPDYMNLRAFVLAAEVIRNQVREQGF